jgi:hypothetical protein
MSWDAITTNVRLPRIIALKRTGRNPPIPANQRRDRSAPTRVVDNGGQRTLPSKGSSGIVNP